MNADTREPRKDTKKESRKDDGKKAEAADDDGATRALSAIAGALARARDGDDAATALEPDIDQQPRPRGSLVGGPSDAAAHALQAIARKHAVSADIAAPTVGAAVTRPVGAQSKRRSLYDRIVENEDDLTGLVAYALSKQRKRDWNAAFNAETGRAPREEEAYAFLLGEGTDKQLRAYRQQAAGILRLHAESVSVDERPDVLLASLEHRLKSALRWWKFIPAAAFGALAVLILLAGLAHVLPIMGFDPGFSLSLSAT